VTTQAQILELFDGLSTELGMATLLVTHDMGVVAGHANRVFVMYAVPGRAAAATIRGELPSAAAPPSGCRFRTRCPAAQAVCAEEEPAMRTFGPGHQAACHFP
jgi:oligopeptide/dipeptide ABC transporter ATP-binding protein